MLLALCGMPSLPSWTDLDAMPSCVFVAGTERSGVTACAPCSHAGPKKSLVRFHLGRMRDSLFRAQLGMLSWASACRFSDPHWGAVAADVELAVSSGLRTDSLLLRCLVASVYGVGCAYTVLVHSMCGCYSLALLNPPIQFRTLFRFRFCR